MLQVVTYARRTFEAATLKNNNIIIQIMSKQVKKLHAFPSRKESQQKH